MSPNQEQAKKENQRGGGASTTQPQTSLVERKEELRRGAGPRPHGLLTFHESRVCAAGVAEVPHVQPLEAVIPQLSGVAQALKN